MTTKDRLRFDNTDFQLTKLVAAGVAVLTAVTSVIVPAIDWARGEPLVVPIDGVDPIPADGGRPGVTLTHGPELTAEFADATPGLWLASIGPAVLSVLLLGIVIWLLWGLLDDVRDGEPFTIANVNRMRGIAAVIVVGAVLMFLAQGLVNGVLIRAATAEEVLFARSTTLPDLLLVGAGFLIAALAEAFRRGIELEDEVEGLI